MKKKLSIMFALVLAVSLLMVPAAVSAAGNYDLTGGAIQVTSLEVPCVPPLGEDDFNAEPETLVVDGTALDAQTGEVTITGEVTALNLGAGWEDTAYVEIGLRPEDTDARNAGIYLIAFNADMGSGVETWVHLQDYTGHGNAGAMNIGLANTPFSYTITLTPNTVGGFGGTADLTVVSSVTSTQLFVPYGYASSWVEGAEGDLNEDFSSAHLFYSIIADRRGVAGETYSATVGDVTITGADLSIGNTVEVLSSSPAVIGISVDLASVDFGSLIPGTPSTPVTVTVTNEGNVGEDFTAELINISPIDVYTAGLKIATLAVSAWGATVPLGDDVEAELILTVPSGKPAGTYTATLIFWAAETE